jgi:hypothetical protein
MVLAWKIDLMERRKLRFRNDTVNYYTCQWPANVWLQPHLGQYPSAQRIQLYSPGKASSISSLESTEGIGRSVIHGESDSEQQRCASLWYAYQLVSKDCPRETVYILRRSTSSTTIHYRPAFLDGDEDNIDRLAGGREWVRER